MVENTLLVVHLLLLLLLLLLASASAAAQQSRQPQHPPLARSILYVVVDDLTADLSVFGGRIDQASTPNFERLARRATSFRRAYAQEAVCGPSRNSFLTGRYPDELRVYTFMRSFRDDWPDAVSLPQAFKEEGFLTCGFGKIFHDDGVLAPPDYDQPYSWSSRECPYFAPAEDFCASDAHGWCSPDMPEANFTDARGVDAAIARLRAHVEGGGDGRRFFWAVGLRKPHLDWAVPKEFLDRQAAQEDILLPPRDQRLAPYGQPPVAWWNCSSEEDWPKQLPPLSPIEPLPDDLTQELRRAYLSAVSWADHQLGRLLDALESLGLADTTAIVLHADHGFHLGDGGEWCKMTTQETGTRVPLLVALPPGQAGDNAATTKEAGLLREEIVELVDVMPTLLDVAGLSLPDPTLRGRSLLPLLLRAPSSVDESSMRKFEMAFDDADDPEELRRLLQEALPAEEARATVAQGAAFSQFPRCRSKRGAPSSLAGEGYAWNGQCVMYGNSHIAAMGYAVRVHGWRYAEWYAFDARTWLPRWNETGGLLGAELYKMDDDENGGRERNLVGEEPAVARVLGHLLRKHFWPLLRPRREGERDMSAAVAATRWASPAPPGRGDAVGVDEEDLKEAWGDLWRDDGPVASVTAVARV